MWGTFFCNRRWLRIHSKVFLFDIGRVLLDFDFQSSLAGLIPAHVQNPIERIDQLLHRKDALESGFISPEDYIVWALETLGSSATDAQFKLAWRQIFTVNDPMWQCVHQLATLNHRLILISNINAIHCPWIFEAYPVFSYFEHAVLSFEVGFIKPQPEIYQYTIDTHGLDPADTFYIDDMAKNIAIGEQFGFQCWQYDLHDHRAFETWLKNRLS